MSRTRRSLLVACALTLMVPLAISESAPAEAASASVTCAPQPAGGPSPSAPMLSYTAINPVRLLDTRNNIGGVRAPIDRGCTIRLNVAADVPADAQAVALSMTAVSDESDYFTVYPCASGRPETSNLNTRPDFAAPNLVVAIPDGNREICIYSNGRSHLIVDLSGWWSDGPDRLTSISPERVYDSRRPGSAPLSGFRVREVQIPSSVVPDTATSVVVNLTAANAIRPGYMTAFPCGQPAPTSSNVNYLAGEARAVGAIVGLGLGRTMCVIADTTVHVIVDVSGYYAPTPGFGPTAAVEPSSGRRVVDSRNGIGGPRLPLAAGEVRSFDPVAGLADANDASAVMLNFVSTDAVAPGFLTAYPCGRAVPDVSNLNFVGGEAATNLSAVDLGADRKVCVVSSVQTNLIVDVFAVMTSPSGSPVERLSFDKPTWPTFDPSATDYVIECGAGNTTAAGSANVQLSIDLLPFTSATLSVAGQPATGLGTGAVTVPLRADEPLVVSTSRQGIPRDYHFRCVPNDFPKLEVQRPGSPSPGWYLTTSGFAPPNPATNGPYLMILDHYGAPVWYKRTPSSMIDAKRLSDGRLAFTPSYGAYGIFEAQGYWLTNLQGTGTIKHRTTNPAPNQLPTDHHDYIELPGGGRALISYPIVTGDLTGNTLIPGATGTDTFADGVIQEVDAGGNAILWGTDQYWTMSDYFDPADSTFPINFDENLPRPPAGTGIDGFPDAWDVFHINAFDSEADGDYVVTVRHMDGVFRVDRGTGNVLWTVGTPAAKNPQPAGAPAKQLTIVGDPFGGPKRPHDGRLNGNVLTMLDNQTGTGRPSRAVAYAIDESAGTATWLWQHTSFSLGGATLGSAQQTDNSVVVNWGAGQQPFLEERAFDGQRLMVIGLPNSGNSYRTVKYAPADFDVNLLRQHAGGPPIAGPP